MEVAGSGLELGERVSLGLKIQTDFGNLNKRHDGGQKKGERGPGQYK
jgi:hypothetical protein